MPDEGTVNQMNGGSGVFRVCVCVCVCRLEVVMLGRKVVTDCFLSISAKFDRVFAKIEVLFLSCSGIRI
jgi:hypothetical protein